MAWRYAPTARAEGAPIVSRRASTVAVTTPAPAPVTVAHPSSALAATPAAPVTVAHPPPAPSAGGKVLTPGGMLVPASSAPAIVVHPLSPEQVQDTQTLSAPTIFYPPGYVPETPEQKAARLAITAPARKETAQEIGARNLGAAAASKGEMISPQERTAELMTRAFTAPSAASATSADTNGLSLAAIAQPMTTDVSAATATSAITAAFPMKILLLALIAGGLAYYAWK